MTLWRETVENMIYCQLEIKPKSTSSTRPPPLAHFFLIYWSDLLLWRSTAPCCCEATVVSHKQEIKGRGGNTVFHFWRSSHTLIKWPNYSIFLKVVYQLDLKMKQSSKNIFAVLQNGLPHSQKSSSADWVFPHTHLPKDEHVKQTKNIELAVEVKFRWSFYPQKTETDSPKHRVKEGKGWKTLLCVFKADEPHSDGAPIALFPWASSR